MSSAPAPDPLAREAALLALLYDWHNCLRLHRQCQDVAFWIDRLVGADGERGAVAIMGAGTGRVAAPLARAGHRVVAVDRNLARLQRAPLQRRLRPLAADFTALPLAGAFDHVVYPYSALQMLPPYRLGGALAEARQRLAPGGRLWVDLSDHFVIRREHPWQTVLEAPCEELDTKVAERHRGTLESDHYRVEICFLAAGRLLAGMVERWYFHPDGALRDAFCRAGFKVVRVHTGYGTEETRHRRIYELRGAAEPGRDLGSAFP